MLLKVLLTFLPRVLITAITTMAMRARMIAYSTRPWPFSLGANNMGDTPFYKWFLGLRIALNVNSMTQRSRKSYKICVNLTCKIHLDLSHAGRIRNMFQWILKFLRRVILVLMMAALAMMLVPRVITAVYSWNRIYQTDESPVER